MGTAIIPRTRQIARFDELENGKNRPNPAETFVLLLDATAIGAGLNDSSSKIDILRREVRPGNGYGRRRSGRVITASASNTLTSAGHGLPNGMAIYFAVTTGGGMISGITAGTRYFVVNATADTFQVAATSGGTPITLGGLPSSGTVVCKPSGTYSATNKRNESLIDVVRFQATGSGYTYGGIAVMKGASPFSAAIVNNFNPATSQLTITGGHNLTTGDEVFLMLDSGAVAPAGLTMLQSYWARSVSTTMFTLHPTQADATGNTNIVTFSGTGSGTIWMVYANGELDAFEVFSNSVAIANGEEKPYNISRFEMNTGNAVGI